MHPEDAQFDEGDTHSLDHAQKSGKVFWVCVVLFGVLFLSQTVSLAP